MAEVDLGMAGRQRRGFTLVEIIVVVLILGILSAFGIPRWFEARETAMASDAASLLQMVARANQMYAAEHNGTLTTGILTNACNSDTCPAAMGSASPCNLVACKYLDARDWNSLPYVVGAGDGVSVAGWGYGILISADECEAKGPLACVKRRNNALESYRPWGYVFKVSDNGISNYGNSPLP